MSKDQFTWQPMETAPTWRGDGKLPSRVLVREREDRHVLIAMHTPDGWLRDGTAGNKPVHYVEPDAWMPLPSADGSARP